MRLGFRDDDGRRDGGLLGFRGFLEWPFRTPHRRGQEREAQKQKGGAVYMHDQHGYFDWIGMGGLRGLVIWGTSDPLAGVIAVEPFYRPTTRLQQNVAAIVSSWGIASTTCSTRYTVFRQHTRLIHTQERERETSSVHHFLGLARHVFSCCLNCANDIPSTTLAVFGCGIMI